MARSSSYDVRLLTLFRMETLESTELRARTQSKLHKKREKNWWQLKLKNLNEKILLLILYSKEKVGGFRTNFNHNMYALA